MNLIRSNPTFKLDNIRSLLSRFPKRNFLLVGDSGEQDPEIYGQIAREFPTQIQRIFIRDVTGDDMTAERTATAFANLPAKQWQVFAETLEISL
jgi:phosphatidate phosphatase APP1